MYVFVYGSLMRGYWNHPLLDNEKYAGAATVKGYGLYNVASYPGVVRREGVGVRGELYDVCERTLSVLDQLEDEGDMYIRRAVTAETDEGEAEAFIYVWNGSVREDDYVPLEKLPWKPLKERLERRGLR
ncbi:gamma-glutamylcyclotransferase (GGCT)/AIG2-like uncharacterized protein YtfP [Anaerobacterium chartisolvens]|uniref:Gamma-glutamylcyclotransferase family protein n=1 Tax=Anaerobacterium chartisolvens TaxID=1297424 RepID=A0A369AKB3_9FIRM|nr:gamma-glutamylcyclotransferase family protein [Anaerobacterium chartisolvens]RCX07884.1 gamma-glutamylcyclotransferase (GGCT)/AIG2-like uncharacterized protein YtfP [Anaerobacterium chartisolvens]